MMDNLKLYDLIQITARLEQPSPSLMSTLMATPQSYKTYNIHNMLAVNSIATPRLHISWPVFCQLE